MKRECNPRARKVRHNGHKSQAGIQGCQIYFMPGAKSSPEKSQILRQGDKKRANQFSTFISSYKVIWTHT